MGKTRVVNTNIVFLLVLAAVPVLMFFLFFNEPGDSPISGKNRGEDTNPLIPGQIIRGGDSNITNMDGFDHKTRTIDLDDIIDKLYERYHDKLNSKRVQVKILRGLIRFLKIMYPQDWKDRIYRIVLDAFPEHFTALSELIEPVIEYDEFLSNRKALRKLDYAKRREKIWEMRKEIFQEDFALIWKKEISRDKIKTLLKALENSKELSITDKILTYREYCNNLYSKERDRANGMDNDDIMVRGLRLANQFLDLPSVQAEIASMNPDKRASFLAKLRSDMGLSGDVIKELEDIDRKRDELWNNGQAYMDERELIISKYSGEKQSIKLEQARVKHFGKNAEIIKHEEDKYGILRFKHLRKYGRD